MLYDPENHFMDELYIFVWIWWYGKHDKYGIAIDNSIVASSKSLNNFFEVIMRWARKLLQQP